MNIPNACRIANIVINDVMILPYDANPSRMEYLEGTPAVHLTARPPKRLFRLVFESHIGSALAPIPKRSTSPPATPTPQWRIV